jgi:hypothetical protein
MNSSPQQQLQPQLNSTSQPPSSQTEPNPSAAAAAAGVTSTSLSSQLNRTANSNLTQFVGGILTNDLSDMISLTNTLNNSTGSSANARNYTAHRSNGVAAHSHGHEQQPNSDQVILNLIANGSGAAPTEEQISNFIQLQQQQQQQAQPEQDPNAAANGNIFVFALKAMQSSIPFLVILVAKIFHQHLLGFFIVLGFLTTLHWSNKKLVGQVEVKDKKQNRKLVLIIAFLLLNVAVFFYIFADYKLENW